MVTISDICKITGKKKSAVSLFLKRNAVACVYINGHNKYFDENKEPLTSYIKVDVIGGKTSEVIHNEKSEKEAVKTVSTSSTSLNSVFSGDVSKATNGAKMLASAYTAALDTGDYGTIIKIADRLNREIEQTQRIEYEKVIFEAKQRRAESEAEKVRLENDIRRGELLSRKFVKHEWGRICSIITSQLHPLGIKVAGQIKGLIEDGGIKSNIQIQELIDNEIFSVCENIKHSLTNIDKTEY